MDYLASSKFNAQKMCGTLCLQHKVNEALDNHIKKKKVIKKNNDPEPQHINFI